MNMRELIMLCENAAPALTRELLTHTIKQIIADWIKSGQVADARAIGDGDCYDFVREVVSRLDLDWDQFDRGALPLVSVDMRDFERDDFIADLSAIKRAGEQLPKDIPSRALSELLGSAQHQWLKLDNLYYDASAPDGVPRFLQLPFFADQIEGLRQELSQVVGKYIVVFSYTDPGAKPRQFKKTFKARTDAQAQQLAKDELRLLSDPPRLRSMGCPERKHAIVSVERQP